VETREAEFKFAVGKEQRDLLQWYLEEYLHYPPDQFRKRVQQAEELMGQLGEEMFRSVFGSKEASALYQRVAPDLSNTRFVIFADTPAGIALPWELMRDPSQEFGEIAHRAYAFVRSQTKLVATPPVRPLEGDSFNILMVICRPGGPRRDVPFQSVARPLLELFRPHRDRVRLDVLRPPTFEQLSKTLADKPNFYHVFLFDGCGAFLNQNGAEPSPSKTDWHGRLLFEDDEGCPRLVTGEELGSLLAGKGVPVVVMNACQSGITHPEALYPSVANQLLKVGVRGVVALAYNIYEHTAVRFIARLYEGLVNSEELARAVSVAREALRADPHHSSPHGDVALRDWMVPVLFEATPVRLIIKPLRTLRLDLELLQDQQAKGRFEIDCPELPAFGFVGRDDVMLTLEHILRRETIVLLEGAVGLGKTEMAIGFARWWAETGALDGPIFFSRFERRLSLAQVWGRVGQVFQPIINELFKAEIEWQRLDLEQFQLLALGVLKQVPCLMIWDDFGTDAESAEEASLVWNAQKRQELRDFLSDLRGGQTKVILTSRRDERWLGDIYHRVKLTGLSLAETQELTTRILRRADLDPAKCRALPQYYDLLRYLQGNPLALRVILPELNRTKPAALLAALQAEAGESDGQTSADERMLVAALCYRLDTLDPLLRQRLGILALFQGFVFTNVLAAVCQHLEDAPETLRGLERDDWVRILDLAAEADLLRCDRSVPGFYIFHSASSWLFHVLRRQAFPSRLAQLENAFFAAYAQYGRLLEQQLQTNRNLVETLLRAEKDNFAYALRLAQQHKHWDEVERILSGLNPLLARQEHWAEGERIISDLEAEIKDARGEASPGQEHLRTMLLFHRSQIARARRDTEGEEAVYLQLKEHLGRTGDDHNLTIVLQQLGRIALEHRHSAKAEGWYQRSLEIARRSEDNPAQANALHQLGEIALEQQRLKEAERYYRQSLALWQEIGDMRGQTLTLHALGLVAQEQKQFQEAESWYHRSLEISGSLADESSQAFNLFRLAALAREQRQFKEAEYRYRQSLAIFERLGMESNQASVLEQLGVIAQERGQFEEAERCYRQSLAISERLGDEKGKDAIRRRLDSLAKERGLIELPMSVLAEGLKSADAGLRAAIARVVGQHPSAEASAEMIDALKAALADEDDEVRHAAAEALQRLLPPQALHTELLSTIETARQQGYNPYIAGGPVHDDRMFFGREAVLGAILNTVHNNSLLIYGERRIGKTSILHKLRRELKRRGDTPYAFFPVFVSLQGVREEEFFATLAEHILEACPHPPDKSLEYSRKAANYSYAAFQRDLRRVTRHLADNSPHRPKIVLLLDEVDTLNDYGLNTNLRLRDLFTGPLHSYFSTVMSGYELRLDWPTQASPPFNYLSQFIKIEPLDEATVRRLIEEPVHGYYRYKAQAVRRILELGELRPFLTQKLCLEAVNHMLQEGRRQIKLADVEATTPTVKALKTYLNPQAGAAEDLIII
jgi:tetratricopeptide (TPR) repeat protein